MMEADSPPPRGTQFGLRRLLLVTALLSVIAAILGGLWRGGAQRQAYVVLGVAAPLGIMIVLSLWVQWSRPRRPKS